MLVRSWKRRSGRSGAVCWRLLVAVMSLATSLLCWSAPVAAWGPGENWSASASLDGGMWTSVTYGNGLFVAVARDGASGYRVATSPDAVAWTLQASAGNNPWRSVTYGNGLFVAVASLGTGNRVMTSPDGINWTIRASAADNQWLSVAYGDGLFVAVAASGTGNRVMTSPDGINWTIRTSAANNQWSSVAYGNGLFVAVAISGTGNRVMTSPDGINWTLRTSAADNNWRSVTYGNGLFVAVAASGTGNRVMTSPDGINWTIRTSAANNQWYSVTYGNGLFVAVAEIGVTDLIMASIAIRNPTFAASSSTLDGFTVDVTNHLPDFTWSPTASAGTLTVGTLSGTTLPLAITGLVPGEWTTVTVSVTRNGFTYGLATVTGSALPPSPPPPIVATPLADPALITLPVNTGPPAFTPSSTIEPSTSAPPTIAPPVDSNDPGTSIPLLLETLLALPQATLLDPDILYAGESVAVATGGFTPGEDVHLVIASAPQILATGRADARGFARLTGLVPTDMAIGQHTLAMIAPGSGAGHRQQISVMTRQLPRTGSPTPMLLAVVLFLAGSVVLTARRWHL